MSLQSQWPSTQSTAMWPNQSFQPHLSLFLILGNSLFASAPSSIMLPLIVVFSLPGTPSLLFSELAPHPLRVN